ncbi:MAG: DnaA regulatory inactivator Hda [Xanthomonadales bacterium]|nr:DnaA regulatory inactivator Hda [Xanthomonadales bacterium]
MSRQLPLAWPVPPAARLGQFDATGNEAVPPLLQGLLAAPPGAAPLLLAGPQGVGKTHLLAGSGEAGRSRGLRCAYVALSRWADFDGDALQSLAGHDLLLIDEVEQVAGTRSRELSVFDLYNRALDRGARLLMAGREPPARLPLLLPDLRSRLEAATLVTVQPLPEPARRRLLAARARERGFELDEAVLDYLFRHQRRDLPNLLALVDRIDRESLARQRRVTVPLVRDVLADAGPHS